MSNKLFTKEEIEELSQNPLSNQSVPKVSPIPIISKKSSSHHIPTVSFPGRSSKPTDLGWRSLASSGSTPLNHAGPRRIKIDGMMGLKDSRKGNSGRPITRNLTLEEKNARLKAEIHMLRAENELLKNIDRAERGLRKKR